MHGNICDTHQIHDIHELKQRLTKVWHGLCQSVIDDAMDEWHKRLWACARVKGGRFEHLMCFKSTQANRKQICVNYINSIARSEHRCKLKLGFSVAGLSRNTF